MGGGRRPHGRGRRGRGPPAAFGKPVVGNNLAEVVALVHALEPLPAGWAGRVRTDSLNAILAWARPEFPPKYVPADWWDRLLAARDRLGPLSWELLGGHPVRSELAAGVRRDGKPVSRWNVACDAAATHAGAALAPPALPPETRVAAGGRGRQTRPNPQPE